MLRAAAAIGAWPLALAAALSLANPPARGYERQDAPQESLFDGRTLTGWVPTKFGGEGAVRVESGTIVLERGKDLTGITWAGPRPPTTSYELSLEAMRVEGSDFFAGVTFPVGDSFCSLILGGWGGSVVGLSSINGLDASENETSQSMTFERGRWYAVRIRVTPERVETWLDGRRIIDVPLKGNTFTTRFEVDPSKPLGIASWRTTAALRNIRLTKA
jgi:hypothetical protein